MAEKETPTDKVKLVDGGNPNVAVFQGDMSALLAAFDKTKLQQGVTGGKDVNAPQAPLAHAPATRARAIDNVPPKVLKEALANNMDITPEQWAKAAEATIKRHPEAAAPLRSAFIDPAKAMAAQKSTGDAIKDSVNAVGASQMGRYMRENAMTGMSDEVVRDLAQEVRKLMTPAQKQAGKDKLMMVTPDLAKRDPDFAARLQAQAAAMGADEAGVQTVKKSGPAR